MKMLLDNLPAQLYKKVLKSPKWGFSALSKTTLRLSQKVQIFFGMSCAMQVLAYKFLDPQLLWFSFTRGSKKHGIVCDIGYIYIGYICMIYGYRRQMSNFAELSLRKPQIVETYTTTRSKDNCLNCGVGGFKKFGIDFFRFFFDFFRFSFEKSKNEIFSKSTQDVLKHVKNAQNKKNEKKNIFNWAGTWIQTHICRILQSLV